MFDYQKSTQVINFFARKAGGEIDKLKIIKLIYFADRYHFRKYYRTITGDDYYSMDHGPVASGVLDIINNNRSFGRGKWIEYKDNYLDVENNTVRSKSDIDEDEFSDSDVEVLEEIWEKFGSKTGNNLRNLTHRYPEWMKTQYQLESTSRVRINELDFLLDPQNESLDPLCELSEEKKDLIKEYIRLYTVNFDCS
jgi:uncharacterized phage-associated protein